MKFKLVKFITGVLLLCGALASKVQAAPPAEKNAQVTLTVTQFRSVTGKPTPGYVDTVTTMVPHPDVTLIDVNGMPTFDTKRACNLEIRIASADANESYTPLAIIFEQRTTGSEAKTDANGWRNFEQSPAKNGNIIIKNKALLKGDYEFFILIQRTSDGSIGIIDPGIRNQPN